MNGAYDKLRNSKFVKTTVDSEGFTLTYEADFLNLVGNLENDMQMDLRVLINGYVNIVIGFIDTLKESQKAYQSVKRIQSCMIEQIKDDKMGIEFTYQDGTKARPFTYYRDDATFEPNEFLGKTFEEACDVFSKRECMA